MHQEPDDTPGEFGGKIAQILGTQAPRFAHVEFDFFTVVCKSLWVIFAALFHRTAPEINLLDRSLSICVLPEPLSFTAPAGGKLASPPACAGQVGGHKFSR